MIYEIKDMAEVAPLFDGWEETMIWSCLDGSMGRAYGDELQRPKSGKIINADFIFFAGTPNRELVEHVPDFVGEFAILVPKDEAWGQVIEEVYGSRAVQRIRYAVKKELEVFDTEFLCQAAGNLPAGIELRSIDWELYDKAKSEAWSGDLCSQFSTYEEYAKNGIGVVAVKDCIILSGASSYTVYDGGIEIEIDTREDCRRQGLAFACGAKLILECRKRGLYPSWDAHNKGSLELAEKLGYHFDREYVVYEVCL